MLQLAGAAAYRRDRPWWRPNWSPPRSGPVAIGPTRATHSHCAGGESLHSVLQQPPWLRPYPSPAREPRQPPGGGRSCPAFRALPRAHADSVAVVDYQLDNAQRAWVAEVRQFLGENVTAALRAEMAEHPATRSTRFRSRRNE